MAKKLPKIQKIKFPNNLLCPICETPLDFVKQMYEWDLYYGEDCDLTQGDAFVNIFCEKCDMPRISIYIESGGYDVPDDLAKKIKSDIEKMKKEKN